MNRAGAEYDLPRSRHRAPAIGGRYIHAGGAARLDANAGDGRPREHREIRALESRHQQGSRGGIADSAMNRALAKSVPFRIKAGEIIARRIAAERRKGVAKRVIQAIGLWNEGHVD